MIIGVETKLHFATPCKLSLMVMCTWIIVLNQKKKETSAQWSFSLHPQGSLPIWAGAGLPHTHPLAAQECLGAIQALKDSDLGEGRKAAVWCTDPTERLTERRGRWREERGE